MNVIDWCIPKIMRNMPYIWWRHQTETFSGLLALCEGNHQSPVYSPHKGQWRGALMFFLSALEQTVDQIMETGAADLRHHYTHYDLTVMTLGNMHTVCPLLDFIGLWCRSLSPIPVRLTSRASGPPFDCLTASDAIIKDMDKLIRWIYW